MYIYCIIQYMKLYHYTNIGAWERIKEGPYKSDSIPGLWANKRLWRVYDEAFARTAVFMLLEPEPATWIQNKHFPEVWSKLKRETWSLLLEIEPEDISWYSIIDWWHMEGHHSMNPEYLRRKGWNIPLRYQKEDREVAEKAYINSEVPLREYLENKSLQHYYSVPEVITSNVVPLSEVSISKFQPKLIDSSGFPIDSFAKREIEKIPELKALLRD